MEQALPTQTPDVQRGAENALRSKNRTVAAGTRQGCADAGAPVTRGGVSVPGRERGAAAIAALPPESHALETEEGRGAAS